MKNGWIPNLLAIALCTGGFSCVGLVKNTDDGTNTNTGPSQGLDAGPGDGNDSDGQDGTDSDAGQHSGDGTDGQDGSDSMDGSDGPSDGNDGADGSNDGTSDGSNDGTTDGSDGTTDGSDGTTDGSDGTGGDGDVTGGDGDDANDPHQRCVDRINMFRATLNLPPLKRWKENEPCLDMQSKADHEGGTAHAHFGQCMEWAQNTCPDWGSVDDVITGCLQSMWNEGPPPPGDCNDDCFHMHGHYMNMTNTGYTMVACGFYDAGNGQVWGNQDFK